MGTPEEIKKGLAEAPHVKYVVDDQFRDDVHYERYGVAIGYILRDQIYTYITQLESRLAQVERERDAAVADINFYQSAVCFTCSNHIPPEEREDWRIYCKKYGRLPEVISDKRPTFCGGYNWRGVCAENTKEEGN